MLTIVGSQLFLVHDSDKDWRDGVLGVVSFLSFALMLMATVRAPHAWQVPTAPNSALPHPTPGVQVSLVVGRRPLWGSTERACEYT